MNTDLEQDIVIGKLMKVISVDDDDQTVHVHLQDGKNATVTGLGEKLPCRGDILFVDDDNGWKQAPPETWIEKNSIAIIKLVLEDGSVLLDNGINIKPVHNDQNLDVAVNNTVEYNDIDGLVRIISDVPIRSRDFELDTKEAIKEYLVDKGTDGPSFKDFGGYPHVIKRARQLIETQFKGRKYLDKIGARPVKGILFSGPPGTGKTHLARIIAHESEADFFLVSGPSIISKWLGDTESTLRMIFDAATASESGRAIIFFDEIDSIAERRTGDSHESSKRLVAQLLTLMDGFDNKDKSVVVIAATNRVETLDPALTRPGRFDWEIEFGLPLLADRFEILKIDESRLQTDIELPIEDIASLTEGWSAAELTSIWTEAALLAAENQRDKISAEDLALAYERVASRPRRQTVSEDT